MKFKTISILVGVSLAAFLAAFFLPTTEVMKGIIASPGILGLLGVLYQLMRDEAAYERNLKIQSQQQIFGLGATSHMANKVFDKHVEFCEKYLAEVYEISNKLFREGPIKEAVHFANGLYSLKLEYAAWITDDISDLLFPFEQALRELGASKGFIDSTISDERYDQERQKRISQVHEDYLKILNLSKDKKPHPDMAVESIVRKARSILDLDELVWLRKQIIVQAKANFET
ncbi:hypothetical protein [Thalassotalea insulae]|uniref:hypothetical protein n=1 Tax=Thalassotalea insulae TaxID=2056778 RepID=UPI0024E064F6|nr:hypothetical protein [Thalassotalea insulae]